ncbi:unnamed protein product [Paramecium pentaurelia]|uniref:P-type Cu(+) transporter n=1 Tax=Paramecium pentaurelia TaxID=43138 RepID=A0A8S1RWH5_9CILI|nr:unnamed protein product [Paramecium pentaurelia]
MQSPNKSALSHRDQSDDIRPLTVQEHPDLGPFKITPQQLQQIFHLNTRRSTCEELDYLIQQGGIDWLIDGLHTSIKDGINDDHNQRIQVYGHNKRIVRPPQTYCELLWNALEDFTMRVLLIASIASIVIEVATADNEHRHLAWIEGFAIFIAVLVCTNVAAMNDYSKEKQFRKLNAASEKSKIVTVIRNKQLIQIHEEQVLVGDICKLIEGMEIPADGILLEASDVKIDESSMTGETHSITKGTINQCQKQKQELNDEGVQLGEQDRFKIPSPALLSGTRVLEGEGLFLICVVGDLSCLGQIKASLEQEEEEETPLQVKLTMIAEDIGKFGLISAVLIFFVLMIRFAIERGIANEWDHSKHWMEILNFIILSIVVLTVAIPEGLPLSVTISLAYSVQKMMDDKNLVRKMYACETMGGADSICSDKTGTLTMNKMVLTKIWNKQFYEIDYLAKEQNLNQLIQKSMENLFLEALCCNSSAELTPESGSKTEIAILEYLQKARVEYRKMRESVNYIKKNPFNSARKRMSVIVETKHNGLPVKRLYIKGASEIIVQSLTHMHTYDDQKIKLGVKDIQEIERIIIQMAKQSLRIICVAYLDLVGDEDLQKINGKVYDIETHDLTFLGLFGIMDNLREGVKDAVTKCKEAGIKVRMVTGDNSETARAIAMSCGIIEQGDSQAIVIEGAEFMKQVGGVVCKNCTTEQCKCARSSNEAEKNGTSLRVDTLGNMSRFRQIYPQIAVMARSRPTDKYAMIIGLKECEHIVAVTGDGTNDAPALKKADVGFAMGKAGTQVAKDASAIILMEDNFSDIVKAVMWGRNIFQSIRKFLQFQLTVNVVAVGFTLISSALLKQDVLKPIQMLWVNLIMDSFASLALATEPPSEILLKDRPYSRSESIVTHKMIKHIIGQAIYQLTVILILVFLAQEFIPEYVDDYDDVIKERIQEKIEEDSQFVFEQSSLYHPKYNTDYYPESLRLRSGRFLTVTSHNDFEDIFNEFRIPSRHYTFIFNVFVFMQVFNFINSRKLNDEFNVFANICNNPLFILIVFFIIILQIILVTFGSLAFSCYSYYGLTIQQWVISLIIGLIGLIISFILKLIPEQHICPNKQIMVQRTLDKKPSGILELRRGSSLRKKQSMHEQPPIQDNHIQLIEK